MSVDWAELSTPEETVGRFPEWPQGTRVASLTAGDYWNLCQCVKFTPTDTNPAHSSIIGAKTDSMRKKLAKKARVLVPGAAT